MIRRRKRRKQGRKKTEKKKKIKNKKKGRYAYDWRSIDSRKSKRKKEAEKVLYLIC